MAPLPMAKADPPATASPGAAEFFEQKIRPVLVERCYACHSAEADEPSGGLRLDSREAARAGGDSGPAVAPGDAQSSLLLSAMRYEGLEMPPDGKLPERVVADFQTWIEQGAIDPRDDAPATTPPQPAQLDIASGKQFWAFQPPRAQPLPEVKQAAWPQRRIDRFVLARLETHGLAPAAPADRRTLIRRVSFDLTGLPATSEEVERFVADHAPDAYARLVDRLLASPHYGERLARLWLDVARYAEDQAHIVGDDRSLCYPNAHRYRDWVIAAFNRDLPYDQFVKLQLAADLIEPGSSANLAALGFLGLGPKYYDRRNPAVQAEEWDDRVDTVTRGLLGLTVSCARCHDHKFDPIPTGDYYALAGVFAGTEMYNRPLNAAAELNERGQAKKSEEAEHVVREGAPRDLPIYIRGNVENHGPVAPRRFLQVLSVGQPAALNHGSGRRDLAEAIVSRGNPLAARVIVNRIWALNFGRPLVATPSNFGHSGELPSHPELLDDLAVQFMQHGWSLKWLERELVLSATYQQASQADAAALAADPENRWLGRMNRRRLGVEAWRDAVLAAAGKLEPGVGGPSIDPLDPAQTRRTLYAAVSRLELNRLLALFDYPDPNLHADRRLETTTPLQKLFVLNSPFLVAQAKAVAERTAPAEGESSLDSAGQVDAVYRAVLGRAPTDDERALAVTFVARADAKDPPGAWRELAHVLLASNEFLFID
ncbi:MAG: PSD1 and planctomycete cytochrome C domain-containing protein [Pirellulales bacterium]